MRYDLQNFQNPRLSRPMNWLKPHDTRNISLINSVKFDFQSVQNNRGQFDSGTSPTRHRRITNSVNYDKTMANFIHWAAPHVWLSYESGTNVVYIDNTFVMAPFCISGRSLYDMFPLSENHAGWQVTTEQDGDHGKRKNR